MHAIAVDAMGGDHAPSPEVDGALAAIRECPVKVILCGDEDRLRALLRERGAAESDRLEVRNATQVVTMDDHAGKAFRKKPDSSMRVAFDLVKAGAAQAVVSAGNSGAVMSHAVFVLHRLPEVERPAIVTVFPTPSGTLTLCDMGANVDVRPAVLAQFGVLGALYDQLVHAHPRPRVGLLSNGSEDHKGTELTRAALELLRAAAATPDAGFDFVGYVEGTDLFTGDIDVVATDGFTGNVVLKTAEGVSQAVMRMVRDRLRAGVRSTVGGLLIKPAMRRFVQDISASETGGALLLGVDGIVIIAHGRSDASAIKNAIKAADRFVGLGLVGHLGAAVGRLTAVWQAAGEAAQEPRAQAQEEAS
jgi:glycerol-3-phosphate acyltransferase PlsX